MKSVRRELNVFSMSALDLFASALGAFILITLATLPFFPKIGVPKDVAVALTDALRQAEAEEMAARQTNADLTKKNDDLNSQLDEAGKALDAAMPKVKLPPLDLVIAIDSTSSMDSQIVGLKGQIVQFAELMLQMAPSVGIGIVNFEDYCDPTRSIWEPGVDAAAIARLKSFADQITIDGLDTNCGGDAAEGIAPALDVATAFSWRDGIAEIQMILVITDDTAYDEARALDLASRFARGNSARRVSTSGPSNVSFLRTLAARGNGDFVGEASSFGLTLFLALAGV